jgi:aminoglycoside 6'-N-acetyltransferase
MAKALPAITFRGLSRSDFGSLRRWLNTAHVYAWWGRGRGIGALGGEGEDAATASQVDSRYGPGLDHNGPTHRFILEVDAVGVGLIQWYRLSDFPDYATAIGEDPAESVGIDFFIGDPPSLGRGLGPRAIGEFLAEFVFRAEHATRVVAGPAESNLRSIRALEKAGFKRVRYATVVGEPEREAVMVRTNGLGAPWP